MIYSVLKVFTNIFYRVYYKFEYRGLEKVPRGKPLILTPNHVNGFIDPVITAMLVKQKVRFFARGDVFKKPLARWILGELNMSPMYRIQEGYAEVKKNDKTFEECRSLLGDNKTLLMFPEAICVQERRLRPLKKGLARIIFQTEESFDFKKDVLIIPVGLNYSDAKRFRSKLFIEYGDAISIKQFEERYKQDKVRTINEFTKYFEEKMSEYLINIKNKNNDQLVAAVEEMYLLQWMKDRKDDVKSLERQYRASREIVDMINVLDEENPKLIHSLREKTAAYTKQIKSVNLRDHLLRPETISKMNIWTFAAEYSIVYLGLPIYLLGIAMNYLPYYISRKVSDKKAKHIEFYASIYMNLTMFLWMFYYAVQLLIVGLVFRDWLLVFVYAAIVPLTAMYVLQYYPMMKKIFGRWRLLRLVRKDRKTVEELMHQRADIISELEEAKREYTSFLKS